MAKKIKNIFKLILSSQKHVSSATIVISIVLLVSKFLGFWKIRLMADYFGVSATLDTFNAANTIPEALFQAFTAGAFSSSVIPLLGRKYNKSKESFDKSFNNLITLFALFFLGCSILLFAFAPFITQLFLQYTKNEGQYDPNLMTQMTRILCIVPFFLSVSSILTAGLQVRKRFLISSLSMPLHTLGVIIGISIFSRILNPPIMGLVYGTVIGSIAHLLIQLPGIFEIKHKIEFTFYKLKEDLDYVIHQSFPRILSLIGEYITRVNASGICFSIGAGALSAFQYAIQLYMIPSTLLGMSLSQAIFPKFSYLNHKKDTSEFANLLRKALDTVILLTIPIACIVVVLRVDILRIFLSYGSSSFDWDAIMKTSFVFMTLSLGIIMQTILMILLKAFYAIDDTRTPLKMSILSMIVGIILNITLSNFFSHYYGLKQFLEIIRITDTNNAINIIKTLFNWFFTTDNSYAAVGGLGLSMSISMTLEVLCLYFILNKKIIIHNINFTISIFFKAIGAGLMISSLYLSKALLGNIFHFNRTLDTAVSLGIETIIGFGVFFTFLYLIKDQVLMDAKSKLIERFNSFKQCLVKI